MKILILGGTSFFGREFALRAHRAGNHVTVFSNKCPVNKMPLDIKQVRGNRDIYVDLVRMSVQNWDIILDNICYYPPDAENAVRAFSGRCGLYIFTSSEAVYSVLDGAASPYRENHTEIFPENAALRKTGGYYEYAFGKLDCEKIFLKAFEEKKFPVAAVRFPIVIGPNDPTLRAFSYWLRITDGYPLLVPGASFERKYIYSEDAARAFEILASASKAEGEVFNFADEHSLNLRDFLKLSAKIMGKEVEIISPGEDFVAENEFPAEISPFSSYSNFVLDDGKAKEKLGWKSSDVNEWLRETINWFFFKYIGGPPQNYSFRKKELLLIEKYLSSKSRE